MSISLPEFRVACRSFNERLRKMSLISVVDSVVRSVCSCDEEFWIQNVPATTLELLDSHRIHVVNNDLVVDLMTFQSQVHTFIPSNYMVANIAPLLGCVESLIHIAVVPKGFQPDCAPKL